MTYYVYRIWSQDDSLLYIGYTDDLDRRMKEHKRGTPWIRRASRWKSEEEYETEEEARSAEARAINAEQPYYNRRYKGNTRRSPKGRQNFRSKLDWDGGDYHPYTGTDHVYKHRAD